MYAELLSRSYFSLLDGASSPEDLIAKASRSGISHLGILDRDAVYGLPRAFRTETDPKVNLLCGASVTVEGQSAVGLIAKDHDGWSALCRLLTDARAAVAKGRAMCTLDRLLQEPKGLVLVMRYGWTPGQASLVSEAYGDDLVVAWSKALGPDDVERERWATTMGARLGRRIVATNDVVFCGPEDQPLADVMACIRMGVTLEKAGTVLRPNGERHLLAEKRFRRRYGTIPGAIENAVEVAQSCAFTLSQLKYVYPQETVPEGQTPNSWLRHLCEGGLKERYPEGAPGEVARLLEIELALIGKLGFESYFLTVHDVVAEARRRKILCQGRGSAANSVVCYALGITQVDPTQSSPLFERFMSEERKEPPDIDVDFEHERREELFQYVYERYGRNRAALVNEVISYRGRSSVREVAKVFGMSNEAAERLSRGLDRWSAGGNPTASTLVREAGYSDHDPTTQLVLDYSKRIQGAPRHLSIHVGGFVISQEPLVNIVPVEPATMVDRTVVQWDKDDLDGLGFVKVDLLSLGMLTAIRKAFDLVAGFTGQVWTLATIPREDPLVYEMFSQADTVGVFQIESRAQMSMLPRLRPKEFYDLVIEVAIVRPGPIQGGMVHPYLRRRTGAEPVTYPHPRVQPILERTLGVPLFQEQVMAMAVEVGGFSRGRADQLRRAMGAWRKRGTLETMGDELVEGMKATGITDEYAKAIVEQIKGFGEYGFPESHAHAFAWLSYVSGWLRKHHIEAFTAALINSQPMGFYSPRALVADLQRHGGEVREVSVCDSSWDCSLEPGKSGRPALRLGFRLIDGLRNDTALAIVAARAQGPFRDLADFGRRTGLKKGELRRLAEAGALEPLSPGRRQASWELLGLWTELPLFSGLNRDEPRAPLLEETESEALLVDYSTMGLSVKRHPMELVRESVDLDGVIRLGELSRLQNGQRVRIAGLVSSRQRPGTANGVVFMTFEDETAMVNLVVWPTVWIEHRVMARDAPLLGAEGVVQRQDEALSVLVESFFAIEGPQIDAQSHDFH